MEKPNYIHTLSETADKIWAMENTQEFPIDIESHYKGILNLLDVLYYRNGNSYYPQIKSRHTVFYAALALPSLAIIDPHRTREIKYNLHIASEILEMGNLSKPVEVYDSVPIRRLETFVTLSLYKLVSDKRINDQRFCNLAEEIYQHILDNWASAQGVCGYETIQGIYQVYPNALVLLAFKIHERYFGSGYYSELEKPIMEFIKAHLTDEKTGLYYDSYKTGSLGVKGESLSKNAAWTTKSLSPVMNGLAINLMHIFDEEGAQRGWNSFKRLFTEDLLAIDVSELAVEDVSSYVSALCPAAQALYGALSCAKEMEDREYFQLLQKHIFDVTKPAQREGKIFFDEVGEEQKLHGDFLAFARAHVGWKKILGHNWEKYFDFDYEKVR